jgi:hypothetical protein
MPTNGSTGGHTRSEGRSAPCEGSLGLPSLSNPPPTTVHNQQDLELITYGGVGLWGKERGRSLRWMEQNGAQAVCAGDQGTPTAAPLVLGLLG